MEFTAFVMAVTFLNSLGLWLAFVAGQGLYVLKCAGFALRNKKNPLTSRWRYVQMYWDILLYRAAIGAIIFCVASTYPEYFTKALSYVPGVPDWVAGIQIPRIWPIALAFGLVIDFLLDWAFAALATKYPKVFGQFLPVVPTDDNSSDGGI